MAVTQQTPFNEYTGNNSTTQFAYTFRIIEADQMNVYFDGVLQNSGYTIAGINNPSGGTVEFDTAPASGVVVRLVRRTDRDREIDYIEGGGIASEVLDNDQDYQTMMIQEITEFTMQEDTATGQWDADNKRIINLASPVNGNDAVNKTFAESTYVNVNGDTMTGALVLSGDPTANLHPVTKQYLEANHYSKSQLTGGVLDSRYYTETELDGGQLDGRYYTKSLANSTFYSRTLLDAGQLDNRYYTETELNGGVLDSRYYTESELNAGQLDNRYYTESEIDARTLNSLANVNEAGKSADDVLAWNGSSWVPTTPVLNIGDLQDVDLTGLVDGHYIAYNATSGKWEVNAGSGVSQLNTIGDVTITSVSDNEFLTYDSGSGDWINQTATEVGLYTAADLDGGQLDNRYYTETEVDNLLSAQNEIGELTDVTITSVGDGEVLRYDNGSGEWINNTLDEADIQSITKLAENVKVHYDAWTGGSYVIEGEFFIPYSIETDSNGTIVVLGNTHHYVSTDSGVNWTLYDSSPNLGGYDVHFANTYFLATDKNSVYRSSDGITWTDLSAATITGATTGVIIFEGNGTWVRAGGFAGTPGNHEIYTSTDNGTTWTSRTVPVGREDEGYAVVGTYGNGYHAYITGNSVSGGHQLIYSTDNGVNWSDSDLSSVFGSDGIRTLIYDGSKWVAGGNDYFYYTSGGNPTTGWTSVAVGAGNVEIHSIYYESVTGKYYAAGFSDEESGLGQGKYGVVYESSDGISWTLNQRFSSSTLHGIVVNPNSSTYFAMGYNLRGGNQSGQTGGYVVTNDGISPSGLVSWYQISGALEFDDLGDVPSYSGSPGTFVKVNGSGTAIEYVSSPGVINDLSNVSITSVVDNEVLAYDSGSGEWINQTPAEAGLSAVGHTHAASDVTSGTFADARISQSSVTQHQSALSITESQISDLQSYLLNITGELLGDLSDVTITTPTDNEVLAYDNGSGEWINQTPAEAGLSEVGHTHAASDITAGTFADARIAQSNVTQHESALTITESQISDLGAYLTDAPSDGNQYARQDAGWVVVSTSSGEVLKKSYNVVAHGFSDGEAIYWNGSAWAKAQANSSTTLGTHLVEVIDVDNFNAVQAGIITGLSGYSAGSWYYVSDSTPGALTTTEPTSGFSNPIAFAESASVLHVFPYRASEIGSALVINDISDVTITTPADNEVLAYDNASGEWINQTPAEAGLAAVSHTHAASDVTSGTFADARIAQTNVTQHESAIDHDALTNFVISEHVDHTSVTISAGNGLSGGGDISASRSLNVVGGDGISVTPSSVSADINGLTADGTPDGAADYVMTYDASATGLKKVLLNDLPGGGGGASVLNDLTDVTISSPTADQVLAYNGSNWENTDLVLEVDINNQTGTSYTLVLDDAGQYVRLNNASAITLTVPPNSSVAFPVGTQIHLRQVGAGQVTVSEGAGVTVNTSETLKLAKQHSTATLIKVATDEWDLMGELEAA